MLRTLGIVMGVFIACWLPFFVTNLLSAFCSSCIKNPERVVTVSEFINSSSSNFWNLINIFFCACLKGGDMVRMAQFGYESSHLRLLVSRFPQVINFNLKKLEFLYLHSLQCLMKRIWYCCCSTRDINKEKKENKLLFMAAGWCGHDYSRDTQQPPFPSAPHQALCLPSFHSHLVPPNDDPIFCVNNNTVHTKRQTTSFLWQH